MAAKTSPAPDIDPLADALAQIAEDDPSLIVLFVCRDCGSAAKCEQFEDNECPGCLARSCNDCLSDQASSHNVFEFCAACFNFAESCASTCPRGDMCYCLAPPWLLHPVTNTCLADPNELGDLLQARAATLAHQHRIRVRLGRDSDGEELGDDAAANELAWEARASERAYKDVLYRGVLVRRPEMKRKRLHKAPPHLAREMAAKRSRSLDE